MPVMLSGDEDPGTQENGEGHYRLSSDSPKNPSQRQNASLPRIPILGGDQQNQLLAGVFFPGKTGQAPESSPSETEYP